MIWFGEEPEAVFRGWHFRLFKGLSAIRAFPVSGWSYEDPRLETTLSFLGSKPDRSRDAVSPDPVSASFL